MTWREYHEATKHTTESLRASRRTLDWANMPDPFRHYEGVPVLDLPADPPPLTVPALELLNGKQGSTSAADGAGFLSQLLYHSAAISASKRVPHTGTKYALRVNPSSGNLHPTEFHFFTRGLSNWPDGLYHYRASSHMAEQRATGDFNMTAPIVFVLTCIVWREAWKYGKRAYRYCLHDMGHAFEALILAARAMGCRAIASCDFVESDLVALCRFPHDEWPLLTVAIDGDCIPTQEHRTSAVVFNEGRANRLSEQQTLPPLIEEIHAATSHYAAIPQDELPAEGSGEIHLPPPAPSQRAFGEVARSRRSALDFEGGPWTIGPSDLAALLSATAQSIEASFARQRFVQLYLYLHRVDTLKPGVYRYWPQQGGLELLMEGDQRVAAAGLSLGQDLAGNSCVTFSMIGDFERAVRTHGERGYRYVHFESGAIGQRLYIGAEALGVRATGIGAFFDDSVHRYLQISPDQGQVVYHFAIGYAVPDSRLEAVE